MTLEQSRDVTIHGRRGALLEGRDTAQAMSKENMSTPSVSFRCNEWSDALKHGYPGRHPLGFAVLG
jgi:hypothetical protein